MYGCHESESQMCYLPMSGLHWGRGTDGAGAVSIGEKLWRQADAVWDLGGLLFKLVAELHHEML